MLHLPLPISPNHVPSAHHRRHVVSPLFPLLSSRTRTLPDFFPLLPPPQRYRLGLFPRSRHRNTVSFLLFGYGSLETDLLLFPSAIESIPVGDRIVAGFLQSAAVRAAGFAIVPLAALAPAVKVLYTIMMWVVSSLLSPSSHADLFVRSPRYVSVYPVSSPLSFRLLSSSKLTLTLPYPSDRHVCTSYQRVRGAVARSLRRSRGGRRGRGGGDEGCRRFEDGQLDALSRFSR